MSRMCDFCNRTEYEVESMAESKPEIPIVHICLECAKLAVARMETNGRKPESEGV